MTPPVLFNMISWILSGRGEYTEEYTDVDETHETKVMSICQDILYDARNGRVPTPKHVALAMAIRRVTGRTDLVTMLNGYGHTVSSSKLQEIETAIGELRQHDGEEKLPANIVKKMFQCLLYLTTMTSVKRHRPVTAQLIVPTESSCKPEFSRPSLNRRAKVKIAQGLRGLHT